MPGKELFPHQVEAVDAVLRVLQTPAGGLMPPQGLRTQVIAATGSGKTLIAVEAARKLGARRVLVLVPTLDLLLQMVTAWREGGRSGAMVGVCSLRTEDSDGVPCTTDPVELADWAEGSGREQVTVYATYAAVGLGILQRAHAAGLGVWDLMIVDEAHRTSGDAGKPWAAVHDQEKIPAARRLYMTATPRIWEAPENARGDGSGESRLIASMSPDSELFGPVAFKLTLSECISRGLVAAYQVVCMDITDPVLHRARQKGEHGSDAVRGARLAALQAGVLTAAAQESLRKMLAFHSRVSEAEAMADGVVDVARRLWEEDPVRFPHPDWVWANWLCGEHSAGHRRATFEEFASDVIEHQDNGAEGGERQLVPAALRVLSSVKVIGEGVDTANCDSVAFCDARGSMVDIVQMVGRALRMKPGEGKIASLVVPVFLAPGETPEEMLTSKAYGTLAKILEALRAHDTDTIEALADPRVRSGSYQPEEGGYEPEEGGYEPEEGGEAQGGAGADESAVDEDGQEQLAGEPGPSAPARELLKFSTPRDPAMLARFVKLRVLEPENEFWRRGHEACLRYAKETGTKELRVPYDFVTPDGWSPAGFPLGTWLANQRRFNKAGHLAPARVTELDTLGMVWSHQDIAFDEGLTAARAWAAVHGHFLPPATAVWEEYPVGVWAKNQRTAARLTDAIRERREAGLPVESSAGALTEARREALEDIDPGWCPAWDTGWQRCFRLAQAHVQGGGAVPTAPGDLLVQGEDLGRWATSCRLGWDTLQPAQQWLLENILSLDPAGEDERPVQRTQHDKWTLNLRAAQQFHTRERHLNVPRKHVEHLEPALEGAGRPGSEETVAVKLGTFLDNTRRRADKLTDQRRTDLDALGMRW
ncbi:DEAD/DEAH box helicase [Streptomyces sp. H27-D2]|uniref:DEAD/DEAH box helicase n=1 Tax=Streptomyces sp. H27-D2 TaxID=3046304 RepID=UPI002DB9732B|nr:Helicase associated domain protein [Streptomyces sp. H27-D2]MEC4020518.1 Helicase associated domain protein [Streptomyces sp. H27-D2]